MDQQKRLLLTIVLTTAVMMVWMYFFQPKPGSLEADAGAGAAEAAQDAGAAASAAATPASPAQPAAPAAPAAVAIEEPERTVEFETPAQSLRFTSRGGALVRATVKDGNELPARKFVARGTGKDGKERPVEMVRPHAGMALPGATELSGELKLPLDASYRLEKGAGEVTFLTATEEVELAKRYRINPNGWEMRVEYRVTNRTAAPKKAELSVVYPAWVDPQTVEKGRFFAPATEISQAICRHGSSNEMLGMKDEPALKSFPGPVRFVGFDERYFTAIFFPRFSDGTACALRSTPGGELQGTLAIDLGTVGPGQTVTREVGLYIGPKLFDELKRVSKANMAGAGLTPLGGKMGAGSPGVGGSGAVSGVDPELNDVIDFGTFAVVCRVLLFIMKLFQQYVVNWGVAIILLTVVVKALLYPLSHKQMESMEAMRKLQPQMEALQKKYENDKEKLNLERMKLFQENNVNPFGGCLPLIVQMPVWFALYRTLQTSFELYREPLFSFWINDLTAKDPYYILPLIMGVTMFITQKLQPQMGDPTQAKMMLYFLPGFFTFTMLGLPAGLTLYIFVNNLLSIAQQKYLQRKFAKAKA
jgi:YidC/Oxa1 family membrane protein insertase